MPTALELMDSRKFMGLMTQLVSIWGDSATEDQDEIRAASLQAILDVAGPQAKVTQLTKPSNPEFDPDTEKMTPAEEKSMAQEADRLAKVHQPATGVLADYIRTTLKPAHDRGQRHFAVPAQYKNRQLTVNQETWKAVLEQEGIGFTELEWVYDARNWHGPVPHEGTFPLVIA